jgi:hypothetical protein
VKKRKICTIARHTASPENNQAGRFYGIKNYDIEWELYRDAFEIIVRNIEEPKYDLFATSKNTKCK